MSLLNKLDNYYNNRKKNEVWLMVILVAALVGYLLYSVLEPISTTYREEQESKNQKLKSKIESATNYLNSITINGDRNYTIKQKIIFAFFFINITFLF